MSTIDNSINANWQKFLDTRNSSASLTTTINGFGGQLEYHLNATSANNQIHIHINFNGSVDVTIDGEWFHFTVQQAQNLVINAGDGNDLITTSGGSYCAPPHITINGGNGDDTMVSFDNQLCTSAPEITMNGDDGNDILIGGHGGQTLNGGDGHDLLIGGSGHDHLDGGNGTDFILGGAGNDYIRGGSGDDFLYGGSGDDIIHGDRGDDYIDGGEGRDRLRGNRGYDTLVSDAEDSKRSGDEVTIDG